MIEITTAINTVRNDLEAWKLETKVRVENVVKELIDTAPPNNNHEIGTLFKSDSIHDYK